MHPKLTGELLKRRAVIYIRQYSPGQVVHNLESQRRQYGLADHARQLGFQQVQVIDEDLGRSGSGKVERPGFERLVAEVCSGEVGAVLSSRLARNGRDWHHLIELCGLARTVVIDPDGVYDPGVLNDRLLLGLKGTMSEFEFNLLRQRSLEAIRQKARRGELQFRLPVGYRRTPSGKIEVDPDRRVKQAIALIFAKSQSWAARARRCCGFAVSRSACLRCLRGQDRKSYGSCHLERRLRKDELSNQAARVPDRSG